jgi:hypothetical protein
MYQKNDGTTAKVLRPPERVGTGSKKIKRQGIEHLQSAEQRFKIAQ